MPRYIIGNAQWAVTTMESNYIRTAAAVGMGPRGIQERMDVVQGAYPGAYTVWRRDWFGPGMCPRVAAADATQARDCPNR